MGFLRYFAEILMAWGCAYGAWRWSRDIPWFRAGDKPLVIALLVFLAVLGLFYAWKMH